MKSIFMLRCNKVDIDLGIHRMAGGFTGVISTGDIVQPEEPELSHTSSSLDTHSYCVLHLNDLVDSDKKLWIWYDTKLLLHLI